MSTVYVRNEISNEFERVGAGGASTDTTLSQVGKPADAGAVGSAISGLIPLSQKGAPNGVAALNTDGKIPAEQLPAYSTDEVIVGTWIDGRPIYRITLVYEADFSANINSNATPEDGGKPTNPKTNWIYYTFDEPFIDQYIKVEGMALCTSESTAKKATSAGTTDAGQWQPIPRVCPDACENYSIGFGDLIPEKIGILFGYLYYTAEIYLTIEYIKK